MAKLSVLLQDFVTSISFPESRLTAPWRQQVSNVSATLWSCRVLSLGLAASLFALIVLGMAFSMILTGLVGLLVSLAPFSSFAYSFLMRIAGPTTVTPAFVAPRITFWLAFHLLLRLVVFFVWVGGGVYLLVRMGPCGQNLVCLLATSLHAP